MEGMQDCPGDDSVGALKPTHVTHFAQKHTLILLLHCFCFGDVNTIAKALEADHLRNGWFICCSPVYEAYAYQSYLRHICASMSKASNYLLTSFYISYRGVPA